MRIDDQNIADGAAGRRRLRSRIAQLAREDRALEVYVGSTSDYRARARQHAASRPHLGRMVVLYKTADCDDAREAERDLIQHTQARNVNVLAGGEGLRHGRHAYYVYVLLEPVAEESQSIWPLVFGTAGIAMLLLGTRRSPVAPPRGGWGGAQR